MIAAQASHKRRTGRQVNALPQAAGMSKPMSAAALRSRFFAENAQEKIEIWPLAGLNLPNGLRWSGVRAEVHVKQRYLDRLGGEREIADDPGGGRRVLGGEAARRISAISQKCPEDFAVLARRLQDVALDL